MFIVGISARCSLKCEGASKEERKEEEKIFRGREVLALAALGHESQSCCLRLTFRDFENPNEVSRDNEWKC